MRACSSLTMSSRRGRLPSRLWQEKTRCRRQPQRVGVFSARRNTASAGGPRGRSTHSPGRIRRTPSVAMFRTRRHICVTRVRQCHPRTSLIIRRLLRGRSAHTRGTTWPNLPVTERRNVTSSKAAFTAEAIGNARHRNGRPAAVPISRWAPAQTEARRRGGLFTTATVLAATFRFAYRRSIGTIATPNTRHAAPIAILPVMPPTLMMPVRRRRVPAPLPMGIPGRASR